MLIREAIAVDAASIGRVVVDTWHTTYTGFVRQDFLDSISYEKVTSVWHSRITDNTDH